MCMCVCSAFLAQWEAKLSEKRQVEADKRAEVVAKVRPPPPHLPTYIHTHRGEEVSLEKRGVLGRRQCACMGYMGVRLVVYCS